MVMEKDGKGGLEKDEVMQLLKLVLENCFHLPG